MMEVAAWHYTKKLAQKHNIELDLEYVESCIESYDEWVSKRGCCPTCDNYCLEARENQFSCFMCGTRWQVSNQPQKRIQRRKLARI